jgi:hypothetical protein
MNILSVIMAFLPYVVALLPFVAFAVSYAFQKPSYTPQKNSLIASTTILVAAILAALLSGKLTGNAVVDTGLVLTLATAFQSETFRPIQGYLRGDTPAPTNTTSNSPSVRPTTQDWNNWPGGRSTGG